MKIKVFMQTVFIFLVILLMSMDAIALTYTYDPLNRLTQVAYDNGTSIKYTYDAAGNITQVAKVGVDPINGVCGNSNGQTFTLAPTANLCITGNSSGLSGSGPWTWTCNGSNGGTSASCSAFIQTKTVVFAVIGSGTINYGSGSSNQVVNYNSSTLPATAVASVGNHFVNWTGTGGFSTTSANPLTVTHVVSDMVVTANFAADTVPVSGSCGVSNGQTLTTMPNTGLCSSGTASVISGNGPWNWSCNGSLGGTTASCSANIGIDTVGPTLSISTLANNSITNIETLNISGTVTDLSGVASLTVNNSPMSVINDSFSTAIILQPGNNTLTTVATDSKGNKTTDSRTITLDQAAPILSVSAPADNSITNQGNVTVTGTVSETATVKARSGSGAWQSAQMSGTTFTVQLSLIAGQNTIEISATDSAGNSVVTTAKRTVTYDNSSPSLAITNPYQDISTARSSLTLTGICSDTISAAALSISHDGQLFTPSISSGIFSQQLNFASPKTYPITVTATDAASNSISVTRNIIYAPYTLSFTAGAGGSIAGTGSQTVAEGNSTTPVTATPSSGYSFVNWTGNNGFATTSANPLTLGQVGSSYSITANFSALAVNGVCGASDGQPSSSVPTTNLCALGTASTVTGSGSWNWSCIGVNGGTQANCSASVQAVPLAPHSGIINSSNGKTVPDISDALAVLKYVSGAGGLSSEQRASADVAPLDPVTGNPQGNNNVDIADVIIMMRRIVGIGTW